LDEYLDAVGGKAAVQTSVLLCLLVIKVSGSSQLVNLPGIFRDNNFK